ncbi:MAG: response regulator [Hyphomicrobium sp.]|uniref:response regulator n=1 Tax=Hyphomicrobium sp. TaxID=82 RepID=UPI00132525E4|nr:response regulator [Hyphomicrobium sp.]KAB2944001.1 MAG: response regulator [Hyphomicrobium sp.]MBZ0209291.1 response regulator [Hyphomicrobium sp.]
MQIGVESSRAVENKRIFVVDNDEIIRSALQFMLHDENETHELASLDHAYEKAVDWRPDLLLLGVSVVQQKGLEVLGDIAARLPGAKIMLIADMANDPLALSGLKVGAHDILAKPLTLEAVRYKVDVLLGRRKLPMLSLDLLQPL